MSHTQAPTRSSIADGLLLAAVPLASMLSFAVQPMMGKRLLPIYGGAAGTWLGAMVFFQLALLVGYGWAAWLLTRSPRFQRLATLALAVVAIITFRLPAPESEAGGIGRVVWILSISCLPAVAFLFSVSPLLHGWLQRRGAGVPYYVYAISNAGSLAGLLAYPILVEPNLTLTQQRWIAEAGIVAVSILLAGAGALAGTGSGVGIERGRGEPGTASAPLVAPPAGAVVRWVGLSVLTCICMLGATQLVAGELGSHPLSWVGPFGLYLLSFTLVFSGRCRGWMTGVAAGVLVISLAVYMQTKGLSSMPCAGVTFWAMMAAVGSATFIGNVLLYRARPAERFEWYYLALAAGGVIGGLLISLVLPYVFPRPVEFAAASMALLAIGLVGIAGRRWIPMAFATALLAMGLSALGWKTLQRQSPGTTRENFRNIYGHMVVRRDSIRTELISETTIHGSQIVIDANSRRRPTLYFSESTAVGRVLIADRMIRPAMRVGVIGLGAGTLAAYSRPTDMYEFWDIDPKAIAIAREHFSFIRDAQGTVSIFEKDGRRGLSESKEDFDVIIIDAFSGDGIPAHLITVEALQVYMARLKARNGLLLVHASSRYSNMRAVLSATARAAGLAALGVTTLMDRPAANRDWDPTISEYFLLCPEELVATLAAWFPEEDDNGRVVRRLFKEPAGGSADAGHVWTDERHAAIQTLELGRFLFR